MTQKEFTNRTKVQVTSFEFDAIHICYLASDLDKDEFCKMWCKMNASRVMDAKVAQIEAEREARNRDFAFSIVNRGYTWAEFNEFADNFFSSYEKDFLRTRLGIEMQGVNSNGVPYFRAVSSILADLNNYLAA